MKGRDVAIGKMKLLNMYTGSEWTRDLFCAEFSVCFLLEMKRSRRREKKDCVRYSISRVLSDKGSYKVLDSEHLYVQPVVTTNGRHLFLHPHHSERGS